MKENKEQQQDAGVQTALQLDVLFGEVQDFKFEPADAFHSDELLLKHPEVLESLRNFGTAGEGQPVARCVLRPNRRGHSAFGARSDRSRRAGQVLMFKEPLKNPRMQQEGAKSAEEKSR